MSIFRIDLSKWFLGIIVTSLAFFCGEYIGASDSTMIEMEANKNILLQNIEILKYCENATCNERMQGAVIASNDIALNRYVTLEKSIENFQGRIFWRTIWPIMNLIYASPLKSNSIEVIRESYFKMGCGLNGVICRQKSAQ
jgi:hypothetical protein